MNQPDTPDPDAQHGAIVHIIAGVFLACLLGLAIWTVKLFTDQEKLQRCLDSRRTNCFEVEQRPAGEIRLPAH